jgi:hypothetical protein
MSNYDQLRIHQFLAQRSDLQQLCFVLKNKVGPQYSYHFLPGQTPYERSRGLVEVAERSGQLGEIVFWLVQYWLEGPWQGNPQILKEANLHEDLDLLRAELEEGEDEEKLEKVEAWLEIIGRPLKRRPRVRDRFKHGYAVLIGAGVHRDPKVSPLPVTSRDAYAIWDQLRDEKRCGYLEEHVHLLTGPAATWQSIMNLLDWLAVQAEQDPDATVLLYFSGHGWEYMENGRARYCLIPYDFDKDHLKSTALGEELFAEKLEAIPAKRLVVILDACHAAGMVAKSVTPSIPKGFREEPPASAQLFERLGTGSGRVILTSSRPGELAYAPPDQLRSVFTNCVVAALSGKATSAHDGQIGIFDVFSYLDVHVPAAVRGYTDPRNGGPAEQHPVMNGTQANNFPIALKPAGRWGLKG